MYRFLTGKLDTAMQLFAQTLSKLLQHFKGAGKEQKHRALQAARQL